MSAEWVHLVVKHGRAMVHTRSDEGCVARLRSGARYLTVQAETLESPITEAATELGIPDPPGDEGMFLWNILCAPRELFDLMSTVVLSEEQVSRRLVTAYCGSLQGWSADA
ncbi:hypothetical protein [Saccharopolyspora kobensis]|uniref:hypothetical protein n=1 Tax=Saccharopolyspora kobensis TaxID=146035 RepID=UPI0011611341|nr:hypothetical protein [Saccharopolyspora kobensis]